MLSRIFHNTALKGKRGVAFGPMFIVMVLALIVSAGIFLAYDSQINQDSLKGVRFISDLQKALLDADSYTQKSLFYLDQSVMHSSYDSFIRLAAAGGVSPSESGGCESFYSYIVWEDRGGAKCLPSDINTLAYSFSQLEDEALSQYLSAYPSSPKVPFIITLFRDEDTRKTSVIGIPVGSFSTTVKNVISPQVRDQILGTGQPSAQTQQSQGASALSKGRSRSIPADSLIIHYTAGASSPEATARDMNNRGVNAHYILGRDGAVFSWIDESRIAEHAGCNDKTSACTPMNAKSIGIEIVNLGFSCDSITSCKDSDQCFRAPAPGNPRTQICWQSYTSQQTDSLSGLVAEIMERNPGIPFDREHILGHEQTSEDKSDPGPAFDWEAFMRSVAEKTGKPYPPEYLAIAAGSAPAGSE
ncbi:MAG TPA: N-acetylmuramoyl-L-alanine amidase [Candidatus Nanoarchaeia archaeon]|nr:N-acetylmuramoyl-L-alanine amidase [Candidatus Nanoarchaeia archaeon]